MQDDERLCRPPGGAVRTFSFPEQVGDIASPALEIFAVLLKIKDSRPDLKTHPKAGVASDLLWKGLADMEEIIAELRQPGGKRSNRRLRAAGKLPAVLYGHKQETVSLLLPSDAVANAVRHGIRVIRLTGAVQQDAFIKELQRDTWGKHILHIDLTRVSAHERVQAEVALELRGEAPGVKEGGVVVQHLHSLEIECDVDKLPEVVYVAIGELGLNRQLTVADLKLPEGAVTELDPSMVVVECRVAAEQEEPTPEGAASAEVEPEVIRRKKEDEEEGE